MSARDAASLARAADLSVVALSGAGQAWKARGDFPGLGILAGDFIIADATGVPIAVVRSLPPASGLAVRSLLPARGVQ